MPAARNHSSRIGRSDFVAKAKLDTAFQGESLLSGDAKRVFMLVIRSLSIVGQPVTARSKSVCFIATEGKGHEGKKSIDKSGSRLDL